MNDKQNPVARRRSDQLQAAIDAHGDAPVILVWVASKPRITTMRPIAEALRGAGFATVVACPLDIGVAPAEIGADLGCIAVRAERVRSLRGVAVFLSAEQNAAAGPKEAIRFAIHHSLPDYSLRRDYAALLAGKPLTAVDADYYAIPVRQTGASWKSRSYRPHVDRLLPAALLAGRPKRFVVVPFGYPKVDRLMAEDVSGIALDTITYAPTQSIMPFSSVKRKGAQILDMLLRNFPDHRIAFRPYPGADLKRLAPLIAQFAGKERFVLDDTPTGEALMRRTALVVTDRSSIAMSFGLGYARPVAFFRAGGLLGDGESQIETVPPIGLRAGSVNALRRACRRLLADPQKVAERIRRRRGEFLCNPGHSLDYLVEIMPDVIDGRIRPEWLKVPRRPFAKRPRAARMAQADRLEAKLGRIHSNVPPIMRETLREGFRTDPDPRLQPGLGVRLLWARVLRRTKGLLRYRSRPRGRPRE